MCSEICDRKRCNVHCRKKLNCSKNHRCVGLCGEKCPKLCRVCDKKELTEIFFGDEDNRQARFIELLDCGHVFEVNALDKWMASEDDNVTNIQLKQCPKCKTPIRKSLRYGNAIKKTLMDIELVKKKVLDDGVDRKTKVAKMVRRVEKMLIKYPLILKPCEEVYTEERCKDLGESIVEIMAMCGTVPSHRIHRNSAYFDLFRRIHSCTNKELNAVKNQIRLLPCIYEIKSKFLERMPASREEKRLREQVNDLEKRLIDMKLTDQLVADLRQEILRVTLACKLKIVEEDIASAGKTVPLEIQLKLNSISDLLSLTKRMKEKQRDEANETLDKICRDLSLGSITAEEKAQIVKAIGLTKGHWFKCRNGHVYAIGECGGAMEKGVCPECHEVIGGGQHKLEEGNELAPEMDAAKHAAWSDHGNLENYDQEELRRLQMF